MQSAPDIQLPSLPEVTLRALEACHQDDSYRKISDIVSKDAALTTRVLAVANSALYGPVTRIRSIDQALLRLGTHRFHTLLLTATLHQILLELGADEWQQLRDFWRLSLTAALTARTLATLTRYPEPDQAFMLGMLHNIGELLALKTPPGEARQHYLNHQCDIAADLVRSWGLGAMAEDAMRHQQAQPSEIHEAGHLVKLICLATRLAQSDAAGVAAAGTVFGLSEDLTREINSRINREVTSIAESLGIPLTDEYKPAATRQQLKRAALEQTMATFFTTDSAQQSLRRQLHEVSNPLTIIRQYIHQLRLRLNDAGMQQELDVIREELDRAGDMLLRISRPDIPEDSGTTAGTNLNHEILALKVLLEDGLFSDDSKQMIVSLSQESTDIAAPPSTIRQILINLMRNAAECLVTGGEVTITTTAPIWQNGRTWVELEISDNGDGIPEDIRESLFSPVTTNKGDGHSGLGLSIVKQLIDDMEGNIACRTGPEGTAFRILLPTASHQNNDNG